MNPYQIPTSTVPLVYFDNNATTPVCEEVVCAMPELLQVWGNPSSIHWGGRGPKNILRDARKWIAETVGAHVLELIFTSGGSESNNTVIRGVHDYFVNSGAAAGGVVRNHFMCSAVEHPSVLKAMMHLKSLGAEVDIIPVDKQGKIDLDFYQSRLSGSTALVSVMMANNETGTIFPIKEMVAQAHAVGAFFHTDAVQAFGKMPLNLKDLNVDFASFSAHKVNALKGSGFIFSKKGSPLIPLILGGGQERHRRGGTENVLGIAALGIAARRFSQSSSLFAEKLMQLQKMRDHFEQRVLAEISRTQVTAGESPRLVNTSSLVLEGCDGETLLMSLDIQGFAVSTGAACSSGNPEPSPVLLAMGLTRGEAQNSLRVSFGWMTTWDEVNHFIDVLKKVVERLRSIESEVAHGSHK